MMGYNTTILFLNDCADAMERNPKQVVANILDAMNNTGRKPKDYCVGYCANPMTAMPTAHADVPRLYMTHQNSIVEFGAYQDSVPKLEWRKRWLKQAKAILREEARVIKELEAKEDK